jgi:hypothetical protein
MIGRLERPSTCSTSISKRAPVFRQRGSEVERAQSHSDSGTFQQPAGGSAIASSSSSDHSSGYDVFSDQGMQIVSGDSPNANGSAGGTFLIDVMNTSRVGSDHYAATASGTGSLASGTITSLATHGDSDGGTEEDTSSDEGVAGMNEFDADGGSIVASDPFHDANDDNESYGDSDQGSNACLSLFSGGGSQGSGTSSGSDQLESHDDGTDTFSSGDAPDVVVTSIAPTGAVTTVTITGQGSDNGTAHAHDDVEDAETLPTSSAKSTNASHQPKGQYCGRANGNYEHHIPICVGTIVKSTCQTWLGRLAVTRRLPVG